jgi:hypothetical protein
MKKQQNPEPQKSRMTYIEHEYYDNIFKKLNRVYKEDISFFQFTQKPYEVTLEITIPIETWRNTNLPY